MSMVRALRTLNAMEAGTLNAAALETLISGATAREDELRLLLTTVSLRQRIIASANVSAAVRGSTTAKALFDDMVTNVFDKTAWVNDLLVTPGGKLLLHANDTLLTQLATTPSLMAKARAQSKYAVISATATGASSVSLSGQMPGSAYILLGVSSGVGMSYSYSVSTLRSGGTANVSTNTSQDSLAMDFDVAYPLVAPYSFTSVLGNGSSTYLGVLRCDI